MAIKDTLLRWAQRMPGGMRASQHARRAVALARREARHAGRWCEAAMDRAARRSHAVRLSHRGPPRPVAVDRMLLGAECGLTATDYARLTGDPGTPSTPVADWPHTLLVSAHEKLGDEVLEPGTLAGSPFAEYVRTYLRVVGRYQQARSEREIPAAARELLAAVATGPQAASADGAGAIRLVPVKRSDCFLVSAGHPAVAAAHAAGATTLPAYVAGRARWTPLQQLILDMGWLESRPELYQPVPAPELAAWPVVRACEDRLARMLDFLTEEGLAPGEGASYLDVACCYGWFVAQMGQRGYDARGIELEPVAPTIARAAYGLDPGRIAIGDSVALLREHPQVDVVSCFSLAHHFVLGRGACSAEELLRLVARCTRRVMFFEMGEDHERWFQHSLAGWDRERIRRWLLEESDFDEVIPLGADADSRPPYEGNYGRTLFACRRRMSPSSSSAAIAP